MDTNIGIQYLNGSSLVEDVVNYTMLEYSDMTSMFEGNSSHIPIVPSEKRLTTFIIPIIFGLIFIIGVLGNGCLILVFFKHRAMRNVPNM